MQKCVLLIPPVVIHLHPVLPVVSYVEKYKLLKWCLLIFWGRMGEQIFRAASPPWLHWGIVDHPDKGTNNN